MGLGLLAGAVLHVRAAAAQQPTPPRPRPDSAVRPSRDSTVVKVPIPPQADSLIRQDSLRRGKVPSAVPLPPKVAKDTIKAPIARSEMPAELEPGRWSWDRAAFFATNAQNLAELLDRIPGFTSFRTGWIAAPSTGAYLGDARRVRVFLDGVEHEELDPRMGGVLDLSRIPLWQLEQVRVEQMADELRVYLRSWQVERTTPFTRVDVTTGDQQTNLYRAFFGRRFAHGELLQFAAQQYGTTPDRLSASSDELALQARLGWAHGPWSVDGTLLRVGHNRGLIRGPLVGDSIVGMQSSRGDSHLRLGYGSPDSGTPWLQVMAATASYHFTGVPVTRATGDTTPVPAADTTLWRPQYLVAGGTTLGGVKLSATDRIRAGTGKSYNTPSARASWQWSSLALSAFVEGKGTDSTARRELAARLSPLSFIRLSAAVGSVSDHRDADSARTEQYLRAEAGLKFRELWLSAGIARRDSAPTVAPLVLDQQLAPRASPAATATFVALKGRLFQSVFIDAWGQRWSDTTGIYRPRYQARTELYVFTTLPGRFKPGNFSVLASLTHEYRSDTFFPAGTGALIKAPGYRTLTSLVQIHLISADVFWQFRNILGEKYAQVPKFDQPRQLTLYGVRWEFWN
ncbi:MAG: TonB-dependent receptor plug [Gemmatimonadetes bacterium]|nr:TonB-dependent receptor plug [Gemmatimonadota bacterium]